MRYEDFVTELQKAFPELTVHEPDLPHTAMGDLVLLLKDTIGEEERFDALSNRVLCFIERAGSSDDERLVGLVAVSFIENLHMLGAACGGFVDKLVGPGVQRARRQVSGPLCGP